MPCVLCRYCVKASSHCLYLCNRIVSEDGRVRVAGKRCDLSDNGLVMGGRVVWGVLWLWSFSTASKNLYGDMECSSFRWLNIPAIMF